MYYPFFLTYILTGLIIAIIVFAWAIKNDQFSEQQRARYLALENKNRDTRCSSKKNKLEMVAIIALVIAGICSSFALVGYAIITQ
ncbi:MAG: hypothetical protein HKO79_06040 [Desulfobacterales bacterium]|nr:hypothetical protein [Desulfobacterales bacterium]